MFFASIAFTYAFTHKDYQIHTKVKVITWVLMRYVWILLGFNLNICGFYWVLIQICVDLCGINV